MTGTSKGQRGKKSKLGRNAFHKAFSFPGQSSTGAATNDAAGTTRRSTKRSNTIGCGVVSDDDTMCSSTIDKDGMLIFPTVQRLSVSCPPASILNGIPGLKQHQPRSDGLRSLGLLRSSSARNTASLSSSAPSTFPARSPYQSKKAQKNLPATLKTCRKTSSKHSLGHSAWERRQPSPSTSAQRSMLMEGITEEREAARNEASTDSYEYLPVEVSPAYKFVPIGFAEDDDGEIDSFNEDDYDICKVPEEELMEMAAPVLSKVSIVEVDKYSTQEESRSSDELDAIHASRHHDVPPSPVPTDGTSEESLVHDRASSKPDRHGTADKYCVAVECREGDDWFPTVKEEVMKLSSLFTCGGDIVS